MLVLSATSAIRPASHLDSYHYYHGAPRSAVPCHPALKLDFFHQPSAEELEEREYRRTLEVVANHHRHQAEKEVAIRRQQLAEAALATELERRRQEELLATRRAGSSVRSGPERVWSHC